MPFDLDGTEETRRGGVESFDEAKRGNVDTEMPCRIEDGRTRFYREGAAVDGEGCHFK